MVYTIRLLDILLRKENLEYGWICFLFSNVHVSHQSKVAGSSCIDTVDKGAIFWKRQMMLQLGWPSKLHLDYSTNFLIQNLRFPIFLKTNREKNR